MSETTLRIGTRRSPLAMWQAEHVRDQLVAAHPGLRVELVPIETKGDKILDVALSKVGGKGLFVKELELALLAGEVDLCVHSTKDMPTELPEGLALICFPPRADPADALVMGGHGGLGALPDGARVGTSSLRRQAQLLHLRPDLEIVSVRGNIQTRMKKVEELGLSCVVLAAAGLERMASAEHIGHRFSPDEMLPAAAQGVLAIEGRTSDARVTALVQALDDAAARTAVLAERAFLRRLGGGCQVPIGAYATIEGTRLTLHGLAARPDGSVLVRAAQQGDVHDPERLGAALGDEVLAHGGRKILTSLGVDVPTTAAVALPSAVAHSAAEPTLTGMTVMVTRDEAPNDPISRALMAAGANVLPTPLMVRESPADGALLEAAVRQLTRYDCIAFASAVAVERFFDRLMAAGGDLRAFPAHGVVGAVGAQTAAALQSRSVHVDVVGQHGGEDLAKALHASMALAGKRVLLPRTEGGREELGDALEARGATVERVDAYRSVVRPDARDVLVANLALLGAAKEQTVVVTSPRRFEVFWQLADRDAASFAHVTFVAIGETTAQAIRAAGLSRVVVAATPTPAAIVESIHQARSGGFTHEGD